jgi:maltooligosyltrehalose trehalohydrolase
MLFMGEEWGASSPFPFFSSHTDPGIAAGTSRGRIDEFAAFGWRPDQVPDPQDPATFASARLRWQEREEGSHRDLLDWYRALLRLRRERPELRTADLTAVEIDRGQGWLLMRRGDVVLACNWGSAPLRLPLDGRLALASDPGITTGDGTTLISADAAAVLIEEPESV